MSFWTRLKGLFGSGQATQHAGGLLASVLQSGQAPRRGTQELLRAYRTHPWFHAVVHRIAGEVAQHHFELYQAKSARKARPTKAVTRAAVGYKPGDASEVEQHDFLALMSDPNPTLTRSVFQYLVTAYLDTKGEVPIVVERVNGRPSQLWPVPPHWLRETPHRDFPFYRFGHQSWNPLVPEDDVVYMRHPDLEHPYARGVGTGETLADEIDVDELLTKHLVQWFFNRGVPDLFLYVEGVKSEAEAKRYEEALRQKHGGPGKANQVHVTNGKVDLKQVGQTFRDQLLPELRQQERDVIRQVFGVPPEVLGILENSNRATIDAADYLMTKGVVAPRLSFQADAWTQFVRREWGDETLTVGFHSPVQEDAAFSLQVMQQQPVLFTKNEWRALAGREPVPGWDAEFPERPSMPMLGAPSSAPQLEPGDDASEEDDDAEEEEEEEETKPEEGTAEAEEKSGRRWLRRQVLPADVERVTEALKPDRLAPVTSSIRSVAASWGAEALRQLGSTAAFDLRNPLVADYLDAWQEQRVVGITDTTRSEVTAVLQQGLTEGVGVDEMRRRLRGYFDEAANYRAERIARTEVVSSSNAANLAAYQISGLVEHKEWLSVQDGQTRDSHRALDGERVGVADAFVAQGGETAQGPGLFGAPSEDINCRCTLRPIVDDKASPQGEERAAEWRAYVDRLPMHERAIQRAAVESFGAWAEDAIQALG